MELFVYIGRDGERGLELRPGARDKHLAYLAPLADAGRIRFAGPLRDAQGQPCGSLIVFEAEDLAEARTLAENDPYNVEGVFASVEVFGSMQVLPAASE